MKRFMLIMLVMLILPVIGLSQTVGDLYTTNIQTTTLVNADDDTLTFHIPNRLNSNRDIGLWVKINYTSGTEDSFSVDYMEAVGLDSDQENSNALTSVVDNLSLSDNTWYAYNIVPILSEYILIVVKHIELGSTSDNATVSVRLVYR